MIALAAKLLPDTVTVVLGGPDAGEIVSANAPTVKVADAVAVPSVAEIVCEPEEALLGIVIVALNVPVPDDVIDDGTVAMLLLSNFIVMTLLAPKLEPVTVTCVPVLPLFGVKVMDAPGAVTTKSFVAVFTPSLAAILYVPAATFVGTFIVVLNVPDTVPVTSLTN
jgi:hypothetical protein